MTDTTYVIYCCNSRDYSRVTKVKNSKGEVTVFDTFETAQKKAYRYNELMNSPTSMTRNNYWVGSLHD